jgi:ribonuclease P protein component
VLPKNARLTTSADFARATKSGTRVTTKNYVGYLYITPAENSSTPILGPKCGLIINKGVGGSVVRHTLARKIRHSVAPLIIKLPVGSLLVIRALTNESIKNSKFSLEVETLISRLIEKSHKSAVAR